MGKGEFGKRQIGNRQNGKKGEMEKKVKYVKSNKE
jgi:hypothetical protein